MHISQKLLKQVGGGGVACAFPLVFNRGRYRRIGIRRRV
jgi:hypothetical protein